MSTRTSKAIRDALKAAGFGRADISVYNHSYSMGSTVHVKIRRAEIPLKQVEAIASKHERIDRDSATGEILGGGNTFVDVRYDDDALRVYAMRAKAQLDMGRWQFGPFRLTTDDKFTHSIWRDDGDGVGRHVMKIDRDSDGARFVALLAAEGRLDLLEQPMPTPSNDAEPAPASAPQGVPDAPPMRDEADTPERFDELVARAREAGESLSALTPQAEPSPAVVRASSLLSPIALVGAEQHEADYLGACIDNLVNPIRDGRLSAREALERIARLAFTAGRFGHR